MAFFWFIVSGVALLSLLTYTPDDIPFEVSLPNSPIHNFVGPAGAYIAWCLTLLFGKTAYFLVPLTLFWSLAKWSGKKPQALWLKIFSTALFFTAACAVFSLVGDESGATRFGAGGIVGFYFSNFLSTTFGRAGLLLALLLFFLAVILAT